MNTLEITMDNTESSQVKDNINQERYDFIEILGALTYTLIKTKASKFIID